MIKRSTKLVLDILLRELKELKNDSKRLFLGGFSLGCCITLASFLKFPAIKGPIGGVFCASGIFGAEMEWKLYRS
jgi:predicted esterase